ncbi:MAG: hypothetical protein KA807_15435 [Prolixibacteraceae bacterium]|nr:hypothetical protein [Prolixibacteraceae bacterium]
MKKSLITLCIILIGISASAQISTLLEKGQSGIGLKGTYESSYGFYSLGGKIGVSFKGNVDFEFTYQNHIWGMEENDLLANGATSDYYEGKVTWWLIRKEIIPDINVNFGPSLGFCYGPFSNYLYMMNDGVIADYGYYMDGQLGIASSVDFHVGNNWHLQPTFALIYEIGRQQTKLNSGEIYESDNGVNGKVGLTVLKRFSKGDALYVDFEQWTETYGPYPFYQLSFGYVLPL